MNRVDRMSAKPLVSAIVANWNGARDLEQELPSLCSQTYEPLEILVVDNGSTDDSAEVVRSFPKAQWVPLGRNIGLAGALNDGVRRSKGELVLLLNDDMRFARDFVEQLAMPLIDDETIFASDAMQYDWEGSRVVHAATYLGRKNGRKPIAVDEIIPGLFVRQEMVEDTTPVLMASGANLMARKALFLELGGLDFRYTMSYEDVDICWRAWMRGLKTVFVPKAVCWHNVGRSAKISPEGARLRSRGIQKGRLLFAFKLLPKRHIVLLEARTILGSIKDVARLQWNVLSSRAQIMMEHILQMPNLWRERRRLFKESKTSPSDVHDYLSRLGRRTVE
ncbi:MAG: glycosyltransferase family 2 protein [Deltaproteobacteria bacterium]|nr:glycosyltransferase family 2 protein [Deltaproteobacteria bacterium]